ncbi:MAG: hypothetical protein JSW71_04535 [Gemmatimonadota bacterium]|nr:MAG: hypothetical protein JSW71_04535 [Gemmatimonadota bacterium]
MFAADTVGCYKKSPDAWQTKVQSSFRLPFPLPWVMIAAALLGVAYTIVSFYEPDLQAVWPLVLQAVLIAAIANAVVYCEMLLDEVADAFPQLLDDAPERTRQWLRQWYDNIFWSSKNIITGLVLAAVAAVTGTEVVLHFFHSVPGRACGFFFICTIGFLGGSMLWTMIGIARLMASLGSSVSIAPSIFDSSTSAVRAASSVLWKVSLAAAILYVLSIAIRLLCPAERSSLSLALTAVFGAFIVLYFIIPQVNIHKTLVRLKRERLGTLVKQIDDTFDRVAVSPTRENISQLRDLFDLQRVINGKRSWSFGTPELLVLLGTIIVPLSLFALKCLLNEE